MTRRQHLYAMTILAMCAGGEQHAHAATTHKHKAHTKAATAAASPVTPAPVHTATRHRRTAENAPAPHAEDLIVTGTHAANRSARQSMSPISVLTGATLQRSGQMNLADAITRTYAQINVQAEGYDTGSLTSAIQMRGLNPNEVLVLVDGERRHTTANISSDPGPYFGSTPVDLNMLPANAIDHIEVLEDGAAAMYGSDAIAGVVNIITKHTDHGINTSAQTGANPYEGQGWNYQLNADGGFKVLGNGYLHVDGQIFHTDHFIAHGAHDHRLVGYTPPGVESELYTAAPGGYQPADTRNMIMSTPEETRENLMINFGKPINDDIDLYSQITYGHRHSEGYENYRTPAILPQIYPQGFTPIETNDENDFAGELGLRGRNLLGFDWHLSTVYGQDDDSIGNKDTANPNLYAATGFTPTQAMAEQFSMSQWTNSLDFRRRFLIAKTVPVVWAFGGQHRLESYNIRAGNPPSYEMGGTQGYAGLTPQDAGKWSRDVWSAWMDGDFHFTPKWEVDFAGRFEHYTDVGNTENGKVSTRYDFNKRIAIRATMSNGFRAPTLAEEHYSALNVGPNSAGGLLPTLSSAASSLGAVPLKPERSTSESGGIVLMPIDGWHIETDVYQINIRDRIVQGGTTNGQSAVDAIEKLGIQLPASVLTTQNLPNITAYYFANGASTRTQGLDIKTDYLLHLHQYGNVMLTASLDLNRTRLHHNGVGSNGDQFLTPQTIGYMTTAFPRSKLILNAYWTIGKWDVNVRESRYGSTTNLLTYEDWTPTAATCPDGSAAQYSNTCFAQFKNNAAWLTDLQIGYRLNDQWHFTVGANNIFNLRPRREPAINNALGANQYDAASSSIPMYGAYYFGRIDASF